jgi:DNA-binding NarL/FixJ family response regulator
MKASTMALRREDQPASLRQPKRPVERTPQPVVRVLIVDDHPITRDGLRSAIGGSEEVTVVAEATSGEEAIEAVGDHRPDVVFMDVRMPGMGGLEAARRIRETSPETKVILFTIEESRDAIADAIRSGVSGYLLKDVSAGELIQAAKLAMEGKAVIHPSLTKAFIEEVQYVERRPETPLSKRESEILQKIAYGATTKEVAHDLGISAHTVKTHLERTFEKLGANDRAQAVAIALRRGLVD